MVRALVSLSLVGLTSCGGAFAQRKSYDAAPRSALADSAGGGEVVATAAREEAITLTGGVIGGLLAGPAPPPVAQVMTPATPREPEKLVIEAWIDLRTEDVGKTAAAVRARVEAEGGRVISENLIGSEKAASSGAMQLRVPPGQAQAFLTWLSEQGDVESRRILATDVSKQLFDMALALQNLELTMNRLQKLLDKDVPMKDVLEIEKELTRVRGEMERIKGEQRWLLDRVAFATITLTLSRRGGPAVFAPHAKLHPGPRLAALVLLDPEGRERTRLGGGVTLHFLRGFTIDLDVFPDQGDESRTVLATAGGALYSDFLGFGERRFLNPYVGLRVGYGYLTGDNAFVVGGELGVELYKQKYLLIEAAARALVFLGSGEDVALHGALGFEVPF